MSDLPPEPANEDDALAMLRENIGQWLLACQLEGQMPMVAATGLLGVLYDTLIDSMGAGAVRTALLMVYEKSYEQPMNFVQRGKAKELLDQISNARRKVEGQPHLILPGSDA